MSYVKKVFEDGEILTAKDLNDTLVVLPSSLSPLDYGKQLFVNEDGTGFILVGDTTTTKWNLCEEAEEIADGKWQNGETTGSGSFITYWYIPVKPKTTYYFGEATSQGYYSRFTNWYDTDKNLISSSGTNLYGYITSPSGAYYCTITLYQEPESKFFTSIEDENERVDVTTNNTLIKNENKWNDLGNADSFAIGKYVNGTVEGSGNFFTYYKFPVAKGITYYFGTGGSTYAARFINWYDSEENLLSTLSYPSSPKTSPSGAAYCTITYTTTNSYNSSTDTKETVETTESPFFTIYENEEDRVDGPVTYNIKNNSSGSSEDYSKLAEKVEQLANSSKPTRGLVARERQGVVNFQFDDAAIEGDSLVKTVFDDYGYKCDFAVLSNIADEKLESYLQFEKEGFGILSHCTDGKTMSSIEDDDDLQTKKDKIKTSCKILKEKGFNIQGWVTPSSWIAVDLLDTVASTYDYGFGVSNAYNPSNALHYFGEVTHIEQMRRYGSIESQLKLQTDSSTSDLTDAVKNYLSVEFSGTLTSDIDNSIITISNVAIEDILEDAINMGYEAAEEDGSLNKDGLEYLSNVWGVSVNDGTLAIEDRSMTLSITFAKASHRYGMLLIKDKILQAYNTSAFLIFYGHNSGYVAENENGWGEAACREILDYCQKLGILVMNSTEAMRDYFSFRYTDFLGLKNS